jgi:hypothetical protein
MYSLSKSVGNLPDFVIQAGKPALQTLEKLKVPTRLPISSGRKFEVS